MLQIRFLWNLLACFISTSIHPQKYVVLSMLSICLSWKNIFGKSFVGLIYIRVVPCTALGPHSGIPYLWGCNFTWVYYSQVWMGVALTLASLGGLWRPDGWYPSGFCESVDSSSRKFPSIVTSRIKHYKHLWLSRVLDSF